MSIAIKILLNDQIISEWSWAVFLSRLTWEPIQSKKFGLTFFNLSSARYFLSTTTIRSIVDVFRDHVVPITIAEAGIRAITDAAQRIGRIPGNWSISLRRVKIVLIGDVPLHVNSRWSAVKIRIGDQISSEWNRAVSWSTSKQSEWKPIYWNQLEKFGLTFSNLSSACYSSLLQQCNHSYTHQPQKYPKLPHCEPLHPLHHLLWSNMTTVLFGHRPAIHSSKTITTLFHLYHDPSSGVLKLGRLQKCDTQSDRPSLLRMQEMGNTPLLTGMQVQIDKKPCQTLR